MSTAERSSTAARIEAILKEPVFFWEVLERLDDLSYRTILRAWSDVRERHRLDRDERGRFRLPAA